MINFDEGICSSCCIGTLLFMPFKLGQENTISWWDEFLKSAVWRIIWFGEIWTVIRCSPFCILGISLPINELLGSMFYWYFIANWHFIPGSPNVHFFYFSTYFRDLDNFSKNHCLEREWKLLLSCHALDNFAWSSSGTRYVFYIICVQNKISHFFFQPTGQCFWKGWRFKKVNGFTVSTVEAVVALSYAWITCILLKMILRLFLHGLYRKTFFINFPSDIGLSLKE